MREEIIEFRNIKAQVPVCDWRESVQASGSLLVESGYITSDYIELIIRSIEEMGPYVVLMPGLALAHARPDPSVLKSGISLITLKEPVNYDCENDPVSVVLTLACRDGNEHLQLLGKLAEILAAPETMTGLRAAESEHQIDALINRQI